MGNKCIYESMRGTTPNCSGACMKGKGNTCPYYYIDETANIIREWKDEAGVTTPLLTQYDYNNYKLIIYTTMPGYMIGREGSLYYKYHEKLKENLLSRLYHGEEIHNKENLIQFVDCSDYID